MRFRRAQFAPELLEELFSETASTVHADGEDLIFDHLYIERRMTPLNIYLRTASPEAAERAVLDYGQCIRDLAYSNIFAGDLLLKNFGVTRHDRVVFYDYDEIAPIGEVHFLRIPPARSYEEELAAEPYWRVGEADVFPEQFESFLVSEPRAREIFYEYHRDLLDPAFWQGKQALVEAGLQEDVFPYPEEARFPRSSPASGAT